MRCSRLKILVPFAISLGLIAVPSLGSSDAPGAEPAGGSPHILLLTLDTTRADALGSYGATGSPTPNLDRLARRGLKFQRALTASPLTLPAHASLLTGLAPPEHGLRDNGGTALGPEPKTLPGELQKIGYRTGAFVASRVLDRRFGLDRGFDHYDDRMAAERLGEYGYPERDAAAVTDSALAWVKGLEGKAPLFLWVHYYDPHAPYRAPGSRGSPHPKLAYGEEVRFMDQQIGRLLEGLEAIAQRREWLVAAVADHGESLGEHGERAHGIFLYRSVLEVPLLLAGPGVPKGKTVQETVASRRLAATLLRLAQRPQAEEAQEKHLEDGGFGPPLPGFPGVPAPSPRPVYSETFLPSTAYGWSPLQAISDQRWRFIVAPRPELYDYLADPGETANRINDQRREARRLQKDLKQLEDSFEATRAETPEVDAELAASLRSLGYAAGARQPPENGLDPKDGIQLLEQVEKAKAWLRQGDFPKALTLLEELNRKSPNNVPFLGQWAFAQLQSGDAAGALATYRKAVELNPQLDFLHLNLAKAYRSLGKAAEAKKELEITLEINPRFSEAWLNLAQMAGSAGDTAQERRLLEAAVDAGTSSALILTRLAQIEIAAGNLDRAEIRLAEATELLPSWPTAWLVRGQLALRQGDSKSAADYLQRVYRLSPGSADGREARRLLEEVTNP